MVVTPLLLASVSHISTVYFSAFVFLEGEVSLLISSGCVCCWLVSCGSSLLGFENLGLKIKDYSFILGCKHLPEEQRGARAAKH